MCLTYVGPSQLEVGLWSNLRSSFEVRFKLHNRRTAFGRFCPHLTTTPPPPMSGEKDPQTDGKGGNRKRRASDSSSAATVTQEQPDKRPRASRRQRARPTLFEDPLPQAIPSAAPQQNFDKHGPTEVESGLSESLAIGEAQGIRPQDSSTSEESSPMLVLRDPRCDEGRGDNRQVLGEVSHHDPFTFHQQSGHETSSASSSNDSEGLGLLSGILTEESAARSDNPHQDGLFQSGSTNSEMFNPPLPILKGRNKRSIDGGSKPHLGGTQPRSDGSGEDDEEMRHHLEELTRLKQRYCQAEARLMNHFKGQWTFVSECYPLDWFPPRTDNPPCRRREAVSASPATGPEAGRPGHETAPQTVRTGLQTGPATDRSRPQQQEGRPSLHDTPHRASEYLRTTHRLVPSISVDMKNVTNRERTMESKKNVLRPWKREVHLLLRFWAAEMKRDRANRADSSPSTRWRCVGTSCRSRGCRLHWSSGRL